ncbi:MAG: zinc ribbon domain-containing protein, partial [Clostridia bacterium]|nr:zinc ribbon domain-containing protein [Clostridia bacterium]
MKRFLALILIALLILPLTACGDDTPTTTHSHSLCPKCQKECSEDAAFCPSCGAQLIQKLICSKCNKENDPAAKFCAFCGSEFTSGNTNNSNTDNGNTDNGNTDNGNTDNGNTDNGNTDNDNNDAIIQDVWLKTEETSSDIKTVYFYDSNSFLVARRSSSINNGKLTSLTEYTNDDHGNPTLVQTTIPTSSTLGSYNKYIETTYDNKYDQNGNLISVTKNGSNTTTYSYDSNNKLITETKHDGEKIEYKYNTDGTLATKSIINKYGNCDQKETYSYDSNGQLVKTVVSGLIEIETPVVPETPDTFAPEDPVVPEMPDTFAPEDPVVPEMPDTVAPEVTVETPVVPETPDVPEDTVIHNHTVVVTPATDPTCTAEGYTEGSHCSTCGKILLEQEIIPTLGHKVVIDPAREPTYKDTGLTEGSHCSTCGEIFVAQIEIPVLNDQEKPSTNHTMVD